MSIIDTNLDAASRFISGDWQKAGHQTFDDLRNAGEIVRDPNDTSRRAWLDRQGNRYTLHAIQLASYQAKYARQDAARDAQQARRGAS